MMKIRLILIAVAALTLSACAHYTQNSLHAIQEQCRLEMAAARTAVQLRDQGKTKQAMLQSLPPLHAESTRLLRQLYQIVDETYAYPDLNDVVYAMYRFEHCARQLQNQPLPEQLGKVMPQLQACQAHFGRDVSKQAVTCVRAVFPSRSNTQAMTQADSSRAAAH